MNILDRVEPSSQKLAKKSNPPELTHSGGKLKGIVFGTASQKRNKQNKCRSDNKEICRHVDRHDDHCRKSEVAPSVVKATEGHGPFEGASRVALGSCSARHPAARNM
jgi:hypothetical protein